MGHRCGPLVKNGLIKKEVVSVVLSKLTNTDTERLQSVGVKATTLHGIF